MRFLKSAAVATAALAMLAVTALPASAATAVGGNGGLSNSGGCHAIFEPPDSWVVVCGNGGGTGGGGGGGGSHKYTCTVQILSKEQIKYFDLPKPPPGEKWAAITCPGDQPFGGITLVTKDGTPAVTPEELLQVAMSELKVPELKAATAPAIGKDGLVGLPEWYWVPNGWRAVQVTVSAGPVYATVTAAPYQLSFQPGGALGQSTCAGPGVAYQAGRSSACTFTYDQSSASQPGHKYAASVTVTWKVSWVGSGGTGGLLNNALQIPYQFYIRVAEGQALVTRSGVQ